MKHVSTKTLVVTGLLVTLFLAGVDSFYASSHPDGLSYVAEKTGFSQAERPHASEGSPFAGYATRGVGDARLSGGVAGVVGVVVVGVLFGGLTWVLRRRRTGDESAVTAEPDTSEPGTRAPGHGHTTSVGS
jgi:hypothetical protein